MGSKQGGETRKTNDVLRSFEDSTFNLGVTDEIAEEEAIAGSLEVKPNYIMPKRKSAFHKRLNKLLKEHKTTKTQLGRDIATNIGRVKPVARQTIDNYASGKTSPTLDVVIYLCERFGCSCDYLVGFEDRVTVEGKYISEELGLTQENIDYLRARKRRVANIEDDSVLSAINLLLKDSCTYAKEIRGKKAGKALPVMNGQNVLLHLYNYLNVNRQNALQAFAQEDWGRLSSDIEILLEKFDEVDDNDLGVTKQERINLWREKTQLLKTTFSDMPKPMKITETKLLVAYFQTLEKGIKKLRTLLQKREGQ